MWKLDPSAKFEQSWDGGTMFQDTKGYTKYVTENKIDVTSELIRCNISLFFSEFATTFPSVNLAADFVEKITRRSATL